MGAALLHGWSGLGVAFAAVYVPLLAGMVRGRARVRSYFASPAYAVPLVVVAAATTAALSPVFSAFGATTHGAALAVCGGAVSVVLGYAGGRTVASGAAGRNVVQRGARVGDDEEARPDRSRDRSRDREITVAGKSISVADETKHFKLIGTTGTGKSTAITEILDAALRRGDRAVIADPDGGYLRRFHDANRGDVVLNPFDERSHKWDLFGEIDHDYDVEQLARSLIPDHEGADRSWRGYARTFFTAVTRQARQGGVSDVGELYRLLVVADAKELRTLVRGTPAQPFLEEHNSRMFESIRSVTGESVAALTYVAAQDTRPLSVRQWIRDESPGVLFVPYKAGQIAALRSTISAWMRLAIFETMNGQGAGDPQSAPRLWFVVDELDALGQIDGLKDAMARLRKFGGRCVLGFQSISQVSSTYGQGEAHTIVENCGNTLILRCSASEGGGTARFASQLIGEREVVRTTLSRSRRYDELLGSVSRSEHVAVEPAVLPAQIEQLPDLSGYLKTASSPEWQRVRLTAVRQWQESRATGAARAVAEAHTRE